uniref:Uncharacterized protein n=1 Tax=Ixodes ricinus TaxID=34613 RepID=A0A6B0V3U7_IXORI
MVWQCSSQVEEPVMCKLPSVHISSYRQVSKPATVITATLGHPCYTLLALKLGGLVFLSFSNDTNIICVCIPTEKQVFDEHGGKLHTLENNREHATPLELTDITRCVECLFLQVVLPSTNLELWKTFTLVNCRDRKARRSEHSCSEEARCTCTFRILLHGTLHPVGNKTARHIFASRGFCARCDKSTNCKYIKAKKLHPISLTLKTLFKNVLLARNAHGGLSVFRF